MITEVELLWTNPKLKYQLTDSQKVSLKINTGSLLCGAYKQENARCTHCIYKTDISKNPVLWGFFFSYSPHHQWSESIWNVLQATKRLFQDTVSHARAGNGHQAASTWELKGKKKVEPQEKEPAMNPRNFHQTPARGYIWENSTENIRWPPPRRLWTLKRCAWRKAETGWWNAITQESGQWLKCNQLCEVIYGALALFLLIDHVSLY